MMRPFEYTRPRCRPLPNVRATPGFVVGAEISWQSWLGLRAGPVGLSVRVRLREVRSTAAGKFDWPGQVRLAQGEFGRDELVGTTKGRPPR